MLQLPEVSWASFLFLSVGLFTCIHPDIVSKKLLALPLPYRSTTTVPIKEQKKISTTYSTTRENRPQKCKVESSKRDALHTVHRPISVMPFKEEKFPKLKALVIQTEGNFESY
ncbi:hypothetical protein CEXT_516861 [Caerostris extrusa]|uniref:Uncharacterized protein n=1 Tax=Caerostris extrusa TaxID=172846 RepID=A0AAV4MUR0_CAEEX|nr:hypothetical protein CEXT_516861 [Caerostris extrusa]